MKKFLLAALCALVYSISLYILLAVIFEKLYPCPAEAGWGCFIQAIVLGNILFWTTGISTIILTLFFYLKILRHPEKQGGRKIMLSGSAFLSGGITLTCLFLLLKTQGYQSNTELLGGFLFMLIPLFVFLILLRNLFLSKV